jgi:hypothetical protein
MDLNLSPEGQAFREHVRRVLREALPTAQA